MSTTRMSRATELNPPPALIGSCRAIERVRDLVSRVAPTDATVLITGETGTGKDMVARMIHRASVRRSGPYVAVNCAAICESLADSEIFGHEKGSFTSAQQKHEGYFEQSSGGTLFLDEIAEMPRYLQAKLLRALEDRAVRRVGGAEDIPVDVRFVAAASCRMEDALEKKTFRRDLYYRLGEFIIELPPLRERGADIQILAEYFVGRLNEQAGERKVLTPDSLRYLREAHWPGNVRELKHRIRRAFILAEGRSIASEHFEEPSSENAKLRPDVVVHPARSREGDGTNGNGERVIRLPVGISLPEAERLMIMATLADCNGNKSSTAELLGISLRTLYSRLKDYNGNGTGSQIRPFRSERWSPVAGVTESR